MNIRTHVGLQSLITIAVIGLAAVFSMSCQRKVGTHASDQNSNNVENSKSAEQVQPLASPIPEETVNIHTKIGIADVRNDGTGCLRTKNGNLAGKTPVSVIVALDESPQAILNAIVEKKLEESCARPESGSGDQNPGANFYYALTLPGDAAEEIEGFDNGIAVIQPERPIEIRDALAVTDLNGDGKLEYFRRCSGFEGTHFTIWAGKPLSGERIWHSSYYVDYDTVPDCKDKELKGLGN